MAFHVSVDFKRSLKSLDLRSLNMLGATTCYKVFSVLRVCYFNHVPLCFFAKGAKFPCFQAALIEEESVERAKLVELEAISKDDEISRLRSLVKVLEGKMGKYVETAENAVKSFKKLESSHKANEEVIENFRNTVAADANAKHALDQKVKDLENQVSWLQAERQARDEAEAISSAKIKDMFLSYKAALASLGATPYDLPHRLDT